MMRAFVSESEFVAGAASNERGFVHAHAMVLFGGLSYHFGLHGEVDSDVERWNAGEIRATVERREFAPNLVKVSGLRSNCTKLR